MILTLIVAASALRPFGTVRSVSGEAYRRVRGVVTRLDRRSVGQILRLGEDVRVAHGALVVDTRWGVRTFGPSPDWKPLLTPLSPKERRAYAFLQRKFQAAVVRKGGGMEFPTESPVPCTLFTVVGASGPYRITADGKTLYGQPTLDRNAAVRALLEARDQEGAKRVIVTAGRATVTTTLMPHAEEASLLAELAAADLRPEGVERHLLRAAAFARHGQFEFARYELDRAPEGASPKLLACAAWFRPVRPPL